MNNLEHGLPGLRDEMAAGQDVEKREEHQQHSCNYLERCVLRHSFNQGFFTFLSASLQVHDSICTVCCAVLSP